jgi:hypothetical protein
MWIVRKQTFCVSVFPGAEQHSIYFKKMTNSDNAPDTPELSEEDDPIVWAALQEEKKRKNRERQKRWRERHKNDPEYKKKNCIGASQSRAWKRLYGINRRDLGIGEVGDLPLTPRGHKKIQICVTDNI